MVLAEDVAARKMVKERVRRKDRKNEFGKNPGKYRNKLIAIGIVTGIVASIAYIVYDLDTKPSNNAAASIDGIECNTNEFSTLHIHAHLDVFVNGKPVGVPARIGIVDNTCLYWTHTHDESGMIHIESPKSRDFTLGQFIDVWKSTLGFPVSGAVPKIFINGKTASTGLNDTNIHTHDEIVLAYGNEPLLIPPSYQFPAGE